MWTYFGPWKALTPPSARADRPGRQRPVTASPRCEQLEGRLLLTQLAGPDLDVALRAPSATDFDGDGVSDAVEEALLARFSPVLVPNDDEEFIPVTVTDFLRRSTIWSDVHGAFVTSPSPGSLDPRAITGHVNIWDRWEPHSPEERNRARADARLYGRATHPIGFPVDVYVVQYYALFIRNAANAPSLCYDGIAGREYDCGDHDGDLVAVDLTVDARQDPPQIIAAIYHNHGRQLYVEPSVLTFQGTHPVMFLEKGTNEPWPNRGSVSIEGWPSVGVTTNEVREWLLDDWDPADVFREHWGNDVPVAAPIVNLGEMGPDGRRVDVRSFDPGSEAHLQQQEAKFFLEFRGQWGTTLYGLPFSEDAVDSPKGPYYNSEQKMWGRGNPGGLSPLGQYRPASTPRATAGAHEDSVVVSWDVVPYARNYYVVRTGGAGGAQYWAPGFDGSNERHPEANSLVDTTAVRGVKYTYTVGIEWLEEPAGTRRTMDLYGTVEGYLKNVDASDGEFPDRIRITFAEVEDPELFNYALVRTRTDGSDHTFFNGPWVRSDGVVQFDDATAQRGVAYRYHAYWYGRNAAGEYNNLVTAFEDTGFIANVQASDREYVDRIRVSWLPVTDPELFNYGVHRYRDGVHVGFINHPSDFALVPGLVKFDDFDVEPNSTYRYEVSWFGRNAAGEYNNHLANGYEAAGRVLPFAELSESGKLTLTGTGWADEFLLQWGSDDLTAEFRGSAYSFPARAVTGLVVRGLSGPDAVQLISYGTEATVFASLDLGPAVSVDVRAGALVIRDQTVDAVSSMVASARNNSAGLWQGPGLTSAAAAADPLTTLAAVVNFGLTQFHGRPVGPKDILIAHTWNGDANLDRRVNADDYFRIDSGFLAQPEDPTYSQGDFNYDGRIDADDYFLIDSAFLGQGSPFPTTMPAAPIRPESIAALPSVPLEKESDVSRTRRAQRIFSDQPVSIVGPVRARTVRRGQNRR